MTYTLSFVNQQLEVARVEMEAAGRKKGYKLLESPEAKNVMKWKNLKSAMIQSAHDQSVLIEAKSRVEHMEARAKHAEVEVKKAIAELEA